MPPSGLGYTNSISQAWRLDGLLASTTYGNGEVATIGYDEARRPERIDLTAGRWLNREYDRAGNVTADDRSLGAGIGSPAGSGELAFTYDGLGRVTETTLGGNPQASYVYDRSSNRTAKTENGSTFTFTFDATDVLATQQKGSGAVEAFVYDAAGNLTREWTAGGPLPTDPPTYRTNTWDAANRLTAIAPASGAAAVLTYDPLGRIATRTVGSAPTSTFGYAGTSDVVVRQASSATTTTYLATPSGARMGTSTAGSARWLLSDLLGSVVASEAAGSGTTAIVDALRSDAYGQTLGQYPATGSDLGLRFRGLIDLAPTADPDVAGPGRDPLYQMGARAYAPHLGTFTALDTYAGRAQDPLSLNRYLYAHANPATLIDPSGHSVCTAGNYPDCDKIDRDIWSPPPACGENGATYTCGGGGGGGTSSTGDSDSGGADAPEITDAELEAMAPTNIQFVPQDPCDGDPSRFTIFGCAFGTIANGVGEVCAGLSEADCTLLQLTTIDLAVNVFAVLLTFRKDQRSLERAEIDLATALRILRQASQSPVPRPVGFASGTGASALAATRLQHGTRRLVDSGVLPNWSGRESPSLIARLLTPILERPIATFDHIGRGPTAYKGFLGSNGGQPIVVMVYKEGPYQGQLATSFVPSAAQLEQWGLK